MKALRSGLIVEVAEAEPAVAAHRESLDPMAALGVPAHVTLLFPFAPPVLIDEQLLSRLRALFTSMPAFPFSLDHLGWFGSDVLWLAPEPDQPFRLMTESLRSEFPQYPPYGGEFDVVVPHLTIADRAAPAAMRCAEQSVRRLLPIRATATAASLMVEHRSGRWQRREEFPLAVDDATGDRVG